MIESALTTAFLSQALGRPVHTAHAERIGIGYGFASQVFRVTTDSDTVVAKLAAGNELDAEIAFYLSWYSGLRPPAPPCRWAGRTVAGTAVLVLDDVSPARQGDALAGAPIDDVDAVLEAMRPVWNCPADDDLATWGGDPAVRAQRFIEHWDVLREPLRGTLPVDIWRLGEAMRERFGPVLAELQRAPRQMLHADLHLDNVLFRPTGPVVLDWGGVRAGAPAVDAYRFVAGALSPADHEQHAAALLADFDDADGCRALLTSFAGVLGWLRRPPTGIPREAALRSAALGDGRLVGALRQWDVGRVLAG